MFWMGTPDGAPLPTTRATGRTLIPRPASAGNTPARSSEDLPAPDGE
jgi:hypothetical protein